MSKTFCSLLIQAVRATRVNRAHICERDFTSQDGSLNCSAGRAMPSVPSFSGGTEGGEGFLNGLHYAWAFSPGVSETGRCLTASTMIWAAASTLIWVVLITRSYSDESSQLTS